MVPDGSNMVTKLLLYGAHSQPAQSVLQGCQRACAWQHNSCHTAYTAVNLISMSWNSVGALIHENTTPAIRHTLPPCSGLHAIMLEGSYKARLLLLNGKHSHPGRGTLTCQHSSCQMGYTLTLLFLVCNGVQGLVATLLLPYGVHSHVA